MSKDRRPRHGRLTLLALVLALPLLVYPMLALVVWLASLWFGLRPG